MPILKKEYEDIFKGHVIIAPHPDDEIIGNFEVLIKEKPIIIYTGQIDQTRKEEALNLKKYTNIGVQLFLYSIPTPFLNKEATLYFPDPIYETHPDHREWGNIGEQYLRQGLNVIFYTINMNAPYIHKVEWKEKEELLNKVYPSQKSLWEYEKKYILFEGRSKWLM